MLHANYKRKLNRLKEWSLFMAGVGAEEKMVG